MKKYSLWLALGSVLLASCASSESLVAPSGLTVTPGVNKVDLAWEDNSNNEAGFRVFRKLEGGSSFTELQETAPNTESYTDTSVTSSGSYVYEVRAFAGNGNESAPAAIGEAVAITILATPTDLTATPGEGKIDLTWTDASDNEEGFNIFRKLESEASFSADPLDTVGADVASYSDTSVSADETYVYQVVAFAGSSVSEASNSSTPASPIAPTEPNPNPEPEPEPEAPVISSLTAPSNDTTYALGTQIKLSWSIDEQTTITELKLERVGGASITLSGTNATSADVTLPTTAGTFTYQLTATNDEGGTASKDIQIKTSGQPDIMNLESEFVEGSERDFILTWTMDGTGPFSFEVTLGGSTKTVSPTLASGVYTVRVTRPPLEDDNQPGILTAISEFGDAPEETVSDFETF